MSMYGTCQNVNKYNLCEQVQMEAWTNMLSTNGCIQVCVGKMLIRFRWMSTIEDAWKNMLSIDVYKFVKDVHSDVND